MASQRQGRATRERDLRAYRAVATALGATLIALLATSATAECKGAQGHAAEFDGRRIFLWSPQALMAAKAGGAEVASRAVLTRADAALAGPDYSVTHKTRTPPSGDKHDYMSMGPYWWPDPAKPGGEPYVRRDGEVNPERDGAAFDVTALSRMTEAVEALALAHYLTDDPRYAARAAKLLRTWFLDPATRMNANTEFAQGVPGVTPGRKEGVLDTFRLIRVVESVGLMQPSGALSPRELAGLKAWFSAYVDWMATSPNGRDEAATRNNHALWYDLQRAQFALFADRPDVAREIAAAFGRTRIAIQVAPDGSLPEELTRTRALHYTAFALQPATGVADLGRCVGVDVWGYATADGRSLKRAVAFVAPYVGREREFPYPELKPGPSDEMLEALARAAFAYRDPALAKAAADLAARRPASLLQLTVARDVR
jgi:hypothetical protein